MTWCDVTVPYVLTCCDAQSMLQASHRTEDTDKDERKEQTTREMERGEEKWSQSAFILTQSPLSGYNPALPSPALTGPVSCPLSLLHSNPICVD
jgi:hypothetical protein